MDEKEFDLPLSVKAATLGSGLVATGIFDAATHTGFAGLVIGTALAAGAAYLSPDLYGEASKLLPLPNILQKKTVGSTREPTVERKAAMAEGTWGTWDRLMGRHLKSAGESLTDESAQPLPHDEHPHGHPKTFHFSDVLGSFAPTLDRIYLASLPDGTPLFCKAEDLCHVALAGATGNGKSVIMRMLMIQLCKAGARVGLLNPHYTRFDVEHAEDWTPFEPYLECAPMACADYDVIATTLERAATVILPNRLEKYRNSQPLGRPHFIVLDELPAIVAHVPDAPKHLAAILREGRKVGLYLICASQDFLVKTVAPQGGGAIRDCYRTAFYVGGDATTARTLLDLTGAIDESQLGQGTIMLRCKPTKQAVIARVPYVDNEALYQALGPSTYNPNTSKRNLPTDVLFQKTEAYPQVQEESTVIGKPVAHPGTQRTRSPLQDRRMARDERLRGAPAGQSQISQPIKQVPTLLDRGIEAYRNGARSIDKLAVSLSITPWEARQLKPKIEAVLQQEEKQN